MICVIETGFGNQRLWRGGHRDGLGQRRYPYYLKEGSDEFLHQARELI